MKMKTFLVVILVTLTLVPETLQANAKGMTLANRRLLSDGDNDENQSYGKFGHGAAGSSTDTHQANAKGMTLANRRLLGDDDDANHSYGQYAHGTGGSSTDTHHVFTNQNPPVVVCSKKDGRPCP